MAVRLRPQSAAWMAPHALAAQLTAQTGQIAGQGVAGLLGGIAQGVGAFTQKREARRAEAINESRYQDSIARQDRAFKYGAAQDQMALAQRYAQGLEVKAQGELASKGTVDPSTVAELQKIASSMKALSAQGAQIGGVQAADIPDVDYSKMAASQPQGGDGYSRDDMIRLAKSMRGMSDEELSGVLSFYTANEQAASAALNSRKVEGAEAFRLRTEAGNYKMLSMLAKNEADSRSEASKLKSKQAEADIEANKQIRVDAAKKQTDIASDEAERAKLQADVKALGGPEFKSADAAKSWLIQNRQATNREDAQKHQMDMKRLGHEQAMVRQDKAKANRIEIESVAAANRVDASPEFKSAKDVAIRLEELAESKRRDFVWASENAKPEVATAARTAYDRALAEYETQVRKMATFATQDSARPAPAAAGGDAMSKAEAEYNALPPDQRTPENAVRIAEKYGVK